MKLSRVEFRTLMVLGAVLGYWMGRFDPSPEWTVLWYVGAILFAYQLLRSFIKQAIEARIEARKEARELRRLEFDTIRSLHRSTQEKERENP